MTWERGRERVDELLAQGELEEVTPSEVLAARLVTEAEKHLAAADHIAEIDEAGAYQLAYDAARKACAALLARQGLRATTRGGHVAVQDTVLAQFGGKGGMAAFRSIPRLRRKRAASEYPDIGTPTTTTEEAREAIEAAKAILAAAKGLLASGNAHPFG
jgi:HEPN domain-containing protein